MLMLGLNAQGSSAPGGQTRRPGVNLVITSHCRIAGSGGNIGLKRPVHDDPLVHDLMTLIISLADRI
jgi:hypothetical protein